MSKIEELIQQNCPDGVEFKPIGDICKVFNGYAFNAELFNSIGNGLPLIRIRDINSGFSETYYSGKYDERFIVNNKDILIGMDGDFKAVRWKNGIALLNQRVCRLQNFSKEVVPDFLFYKVQDELDRIQNSTQGSTVKHLSSKELERAKIPIPPLPIQQEIVSILDKFTTLEAELEAELEARRAQYKYYRDQLLCFEGKELEWKMLGEVGEFIRGKRFVKNDIVSDGIPCIHYGELYTHYKIWAKEAKSYLNPDLAAKLRVAHPGDVVIVSAGETIEDIGNGVAWLGDSDVVIHDACFAYSHKMNPKYVSYYLQTNLFRSQIKSSISSGKISSINAPGLSKAKIPIPPMEEQERIVSILDKFDALVNDISVGLPAEIEARRKQYEYYREKLLSFKNISTVH